MEPQKLLKRISFNPSISNGNPIVRGRPLTVAKVLERLATGDNGQSLYEEYPWLEKEDIQACLLYATMSVGNEYFEINQSNREY